MNLRRLRTSVDTLSAATRAVPFAALLEAARAVGGRHVTIDLAAAQTLGFPLVVLHERSQPGFVALLTPRQLAVARELARGRCNKDIARTLGISLATVKDHVHAVLRKSGLSSRLEVASAFIGRTS
ncbi:MAG: response regulator transcription factor [Archangium sp.]|nr:response regulator transcription factor [Archangium sp.]